jgi:hypothetical protein
MQPRTPTSRRPFSANQIGRYSEHSTQDAWETKAKTINTYEPITLRAEATEQTKRHANGSRKKDLYDTCYSVRKEEQKLPCPA